MKDKMFSEVKTNSLVGKMIYLKLLKEEFNEIEFENFEKVNLKVIKSILEILRYFKEQFGKNIFSKLDKIEAVEDEEPLGAFGYNIDSGKGNIRISLRIFGEYLDEKLFSEYADRDEVNKWVYPERIFIHELIHYLRSIPEADDHELNESLQELTEFVSKNAYDCKECCPNLTLKKREIKSLDELVEEFICEVISIYINKIIKNPGIGIENIFDKDKLRYCKVALQFYTNLEKIVKRKIKS